MSLKVSANKPFVERRKFERKPVKIGASAIMSNADATVDCTILDVSESGAKLELRDVDIVPARFKLFVPESDYIHDCEVVWREGPHLGVKFLNLLA